MRDVWEPTRFALRNASYLLLTKEINRSKTEIQKELSLLRAPVEHCKDPLEKKRAGGSPSISPRGWAGAAGLATRPLHVLLQSPGRSAQLAGDSQRGESPGSGRCFGADWKGQEPATGRCAGLQRRWLAAALKDAHRGAPEVPTVPPASFWMSKPRTPIGWKRCDCKLSQNVYFGRIMDGRVISRGGREDLDWFLSSIKEVCLKLSKIWNFGSRFRDDSHECHRWEFTSFDVLCFTFSVFHFT